MGDRSIGLMSLSFGAGVLGLYCQLAASAMLISGLGFFTTGSPERALVLVTTVANITTEEGMGEGAFDLWTGRSWAWTCAVSTFVGCIAASAALALVSTNLVSAVLPTVASAIALWYLHTPSARAEMTGTEPPSRRGITTHQHSPVVRGTR